MDLIESTKQNINELLGVPENIVSVSTQLYNSLIELIDDNITVEQIEGKKYPIKGTFQIGDFKFNEVTINIEVDNGEFYDVEQMKQDNHNNFPIVVGLAHNNSSKLTNKFKLESKNSEVVLTIKFIAEPNHIGKDFKDSLISERPKIISSLAHELKHAYDTYKKPTTSVKSRSDYGVYAKGAGFGKVVPLNEFVYNLYFIHSIENLVRPTEIATEIEINKISKKDFVEYLKKNDIYIRLKALQNFSFSELKEQLKSYIPQIKDLFSHADIQNYENQSDEWLIQKSLELLHINIINNKGGRLRNMLSVNSIEKFLGFSDEKEKYFRTYINKISKYNDDHDGFFLNEERQFRFIATKMIKKISKIYGLLPDNPVPTNSSINEDWFRYKINKIKIDTEFKYKKST